MPQIGIPQNSQNFRDISSVKINKGGINQQAAALDRAIVDKLNGAKKQSIYRETKNDGMNREEFLKMLTFQLQNQDPMDPVDQKKFTSELAQLSQLEHLSKMKELMEKQSSNSILEKKFYAASLLGKRVTTNGRNIEFKGEGEESPIRFELAKPAQNVLVKIYDQKNNLISQLQADSLGKGYHTLPWNGQRFDGIFERPGTFTVDVMAFDETAEPVGVKTASEGIVSAIKFENGQPLLVVGNKVLQMHEIESMEVDAAAPSLAMAPQLPPAQLKRLAEVPMSAQLAPYLMGKAPSGATMGESALNQENPNGGQE